MLEANGQVPEPHRPGAEAPPKPALGQGTTALPRSPRAILAGVYRGRRLEEQGKPRFVGSQWWSPWGQAARTRAAAVARGGRTFEVPLAGLEAGGNRRRKMGWRQLYRATYPDFDAIPLTKEFERVGNQAVA